MIWWTLIRLILRDYETRIKVVSNLGSFRNGRVVKLLVAALKDLDGRELKAVVEALGQLGDARAVEPLVARLMDTRYWDNDRGGKKKRYQ